MKIYSDTLTSADLDAATSAASTHSSTGSIGFERYRALRKPRIRTRGWDILLYRNGSRKHFNTGQHGAGDDGAASWDDYGWFLAELFERDPGLHAAYYRDREHFHQATRGQFLPDPAVIVVFRQWRARRDQDVAGNGIVALFPELPGNFDIATCQSFEHTGQHGAASLTGVMNRTRPATPDQYAALKRELESAPYRYRLIIRERTPADAASRRAAALRVPS